MTIKEEKREEILQQSPEQVIEKLGKIIMNKAFRWTLADTYFSDPLSYETDLSTLTPQEIIDKTVDFLNSKPQDENYAPFLFYLTHFPVSLCKRSVSQNLKFLIGFHYRLGVPEEKHKKHINPVSMEELAEIFGRSKATIHECVEETKEAWKEFEISLKEREEITTKAERELIEEEKARLLKEREVKGPSEENKHT